jgi:hypothetical protein
MTTYGYGVEDARGNVRKREVLWGFCIILFRQNQPLTTQRKRQLLRNILTERRVSGKRGIECAVWYASVAAECFQLDYVLQFFQAFECEHGYLRLLWKESPRFARGQNND